jgi:tetratricopeptide (TPR) repeat protein
MIKRLIAVSTSRQGTARKITTIRTSLPPESHHHCVLVQQQQQQQKHFSSNVTLKENIFKKWFGRKSAAAKADEQMINTIVKYQKELDQTIDSMSQEINVEHVKRLLEDYSHKLNYVHGYKSRLIWNFCQHRILAIVYYRMGDFDNAMSECEKGLCLERELEENGLANQIFMWIIDLQVLKSEIYANKMEHKLALNTLSDLIDERIRKKISEEDQKEVRKLLNENLALHLYRRARINMYLGELHDAMIDIDESIGISRQSYNLFVKAEILFMRKEYEKALFTAMQAVNVNSDKDSVLQAKSLMVDIMLKEHRYSEALKICNELINMDPKNANYYAQRAECYSYLHEYSNALEDCKHAESLDPSQTLSLLEVHSNILNRLAKYDELVDHVNRISHIIHDLDLTPDFEKTASIIAQIAKIDQKVWNEKYQEALELIQSIESKNQESKDMIYASLLSRKVEVLLFCEKYQEALEAAKQYVAFGEKSLPDHIDSLELRAIAYASLGQFDKSYADLDEARKLIEEIKDNDALREELTAWHKFSRAKVMYFQKDKKEEAIRLHNEALEYATAYSMYDMVQPIRSSLKKLVEQE